MKIKLYHHTHEHLLPAILNDGYVELECHNLERAAKCRLSKHERGASNSMLWRSIKRQMKYTGRYVWLTEEKKVLCLDDPVPTARILFYAEDIGATRWPEVRNRLSKKGRKLARVNDDIAKSKGDDVSKWWGGDRKIPMSRARKFTDITGQRSWISCYEENLLRGEG